MSYHEKIWNDYKVNSSPFASLQGWLHLTSACSAFSIRHPFILSASFHRSIFQLFTGTFIGAPGSCSRPILKSYKHSSSARASPPAAPAQCWVQSILLRPLLSVSNPLSLLNLTLSACEVSATRSTPSVALALFSCTHPASYKQPVLSMPSVVWNRLGPFGWLPQREESTRLRSRPEEPCVLTSRFFALPKCQNTFRLFDPWALQSSQRNSSPLSSNSVKMQPNRSKFKGFTQKQRL